MTRGATCLAIAASIVMAVRVGAEAPLALTVRLYNTAGIPAQHLLAARRVAEAILHDTGLAVTVRRCERQLSPGAAVDTCDEPLKPSEVVVRVINAPALNATLRADAYGMAYVVRETDRGWLATVFADRIDGAAMRAGVEPGTLLGRVMAHEVGHLLLGSGYHAETGVMRADWRDALLGRTGDEWRFSTREAARMHQMLASIARDSVAKSSAPRVPFLQ